MASLAVSISVNAQSLPFLNIPSDPENLGVGSSSVARCADAFAVDNNAASAALSDMKGDFAVTYGSWSPKNSKDALANLGGFLRFDRLAVGFSAKYMLEQPYDLFDINGAPDGSFTPIEFSAGLGVSYRIVDGLSAGVTARFASSSLAEGYNASVFCADIALMYRKGGLGLGLSIDNLGTPADYGNGASPIPSLVRAGASYSISGFTGSAQAAYLFAGSFMASAGAEYAVKDILFLRAGYQYGSGAAAIPSHASVGLGLKFVGIRINATYLLGSEAIGGSMMFGLGYGF